jgi:hypothetical protein
MKRGLLFALGALLLAGCATTPPPRPPPLTQVDVISMVKSGWSDEDIMRRIDATRTVFRLSSDDVVRLRNEGLSDRLVTFCWTPTHERPWRRNTARIPITTIRSTSITGSTTGPVGAGGSGANLPPPRQHLLQSPMASISLLTTPKRSVYPSFDPQTNPLTWVRFHSTSVKNPDMHFS